MNKFSDFSEKQTEVIYQDIETLQSYLSQDAQFFVEEQLPDQDKTHLVKIIFQIQDGQKRWQVEVHAQTIEEASLTARNYFINKFEQKMLEDYEKTGQIFN